MAEIMGRAPSPSGLANVQMIARGLTTVQRRYILAGAIHGDCAVATVRALKRKGLFRLVIDSPNGHCGFMRLTPLGEAVREMLQSAAAHGTARLHRQGQTSRSGK
jgi:hypothetical protein